MQAKDSEGGGHKLRVVGACWSCRVQMSCELLFPRGLGARIPGQWYLRGSLLTQDELVELVK